MGQQLNGAIAAEQYLLWAIGEIKKLPSVQAGRYVEKALAELRDKANTHAPRAVVKLHRVQQTMKPNRIQIDKDDHRPAVCRC
jgi:hypothetical protein